jgi:hypothetical protein
MNPGWNHIQVDETFFAALRKYNRGGPTRLTEAACYVTASRIETLDTLNPDGTNKYRVAETRWVRVKERTKEVLEDFVLRTVAGARSTVCTDSFTSYKGLVNFVNHKSVNHSRTFKNAEGVDTNGAESIHSAIKRMIKAGNGGKYGSLRLLNGRVAVACLWYGVSEVGLRRKLLLCLLRDYAEQMTLVPFVGQDENDQVDSDNDATPKPPMGRPATAPSVKRDRLEAQDADRLKKKALASLARGVVLAEDFTRPPEIFSPRWALTEDIKSVLDSITGSACIDCAAMDVCLDAQLHATNAQKWEHLPSALLEESDRWPQLSMSVGKPKICTLFADDHFVLITFEMPKSAKKPARKPAAKKSARTPVAVESSDDDEVQEVPRVHLPPGKGNRPDDPASELHVAIRLWDSYPGFRKGKGVKAALPALLRFINSRWPKVTSVSWAPQECPLQRGADCGPCSLSNSAKLVGYDADVVWDRATMRSVCDEIHQRYVKIARGFRAEVEAEAAAATESDSDAE